ncbi:hypothetical protein TIFTF001_020180 [Ficus carica]|uniref:Uncharacterized protein n=1 Tax=Ficus carica TaxID=3494 RepID=A0AA88D9L0_FICCA|nr:hypothetical protein TIFTF001_020180 [Ficus carica]
MNWIFSIEVFGFLFYNPSFPSPATVTSVSSLTVQAGVDRSRPLHFPSTNPDRPFPISTSSLATRSSAAVEQSRYEVAVEEISLSHESLLGCAIRELHRNRKLSQEPRRCRSNHVVAVRDNAGGTFAREDDITGEEDGGDRGERRKGRGSFRIFEH